MSTAKRTAAYRARQRVGVAILRVPVPLYPVIEALIASQRISVADALDRRQVERAAGELLADIATEWAKKL